MIYMSDGKDIIKTATGWYGFRPESAHNMYQAHYAIDKISID